MFLRVFYKKYASSLSRSQKFLVDFFLWLGALIIFSFLVFVPYSIWWLHASGDAAMERAVEAQAKGDFTLFGSGLSQDFVDYKLHLYEIVKPEVVAIGSSRVMQFRGSWFRESFINMGGVAGNLGALRSTIDAILHMGKPKAMILGLDFWWFLPQWEKDPDEIIPVTSGSYNYGLESLKKPWAWFLDGKISVGDLLAPIFGIFGKGFRTDRLGIMAQKTSDGFGPDGSWYYTAEISGLKPPFDFQFRDTLSQVEHGIKAFYYAGKGQTEPAEGHIDAMADILCRLKARQVQVFVFIPPLSPRVFNAMQGKENLYPHLFKLCEALDKRGIDVMDFSNPRSLGTNDCEFVDGFHGGDVTYARILRRMADHWPALLAYVNMEKLDAVIRDWPGHAMIPDVRVTSLPEIDFMRINCSKKNIAEKR